MLTLKNGQKLVINPKPLGEGGEGTVYIIERPLQYKGHVVKLLHLNKRTPERESRISHMINHSPKTKDTLGHHFLIWPEEMVLEKKEFAGFIMPKVVGETLEMICQNTKSLPQPFDKFNLNRQVGFLNRNKLGQNISAAVATLHESSKYVLSDLKPINIIVKPNGKISIIDLDSIQIIEKGKLIFPATVSTPEYSPPEISKGPLKKSWDDFSLAVILYRLFTGVHPFTGSLKAPYKDFTSYDQLIQGGFFPHSSKKRHFHVIPPPHDNFHQYSNKIQKGFIESLGKGTSDSKHRLNAAQWYSTLNTVPVFVKPLKVDRNLIFAGQSVTLSWEINYAQEVKIEPQMGQIKGNSFVIQIQKPTNFKVTGKNIFGEVSQELNLGVIGLPTPDVLSIPTAQIQLKTSIKPHPVSLDSDIFHKTQNSKNLIPDLTTPKQPRNILEDLNDNYLWIEHLLEDTSYEASLEEKLKHQIVVITRKLKEFSKRLFKQN